MIRIVIVDDHPALVAGLTAVLRSEPGFVPVGSASTDSELWPLLYRTAPDIVVLDYHLPRTDGLRLCRKIADQPAGPRVVIYSAYADPALGLGARAAGAHAMAGKAAPAREFFELLRRVHKGEHVLPDMTSEDVTAACARQEPEDQPLLTMLLDGARPSDVAEAMRLSSEEIGWRVERVLSRLRAEVASGTA